MFARLSRLNRLACRPALVAATVALILVAAAMGAAGPPSPQSVRVAGAVRDSSGASIPNAQVTLQSGTLVSTTITDEQGNFVFAPLTDSKATGTVTVNAPGFAFFQQGWSATDPDIGRLEITLQPAGISEQVTVTAMRTSTRIDQTAADVSLLTQEDLASTSALRLDDALRQIPGFMLFRRSGSRTANPTSQGVSLRGVGASGPSRALVLEDGIPFTDPFGGWVYWDRVPREEVGTVEVVEGGASDLYGSDAMGGVINIRTRPINLSHLSLEASYGNENTPYLSLSSSLALGQWSLGVSTEAFHTDGYVLVPENLRGPVDNQANVDDRAINATLERRLSDRARVFVRGEYLGELRHNGKVDEGNHTNIRQLAAGADWQSAILGSFSLRGYGGAELLDQNFYAVGPERLTETLTDVQRVPVQDIGFSAQWSRPVGSVQTLVAGFEADGVRGASDEFKFLGGSPVATSAVGAGGRQRTLAVFGEDIFHFGSKWVVTAGARIDDWQNYDALSTTRPLTIPGPTTVIVFPNRSEQAFSPRLSVLRQISNDWSATASIYRAFRAPTLNELYRSFRLSNVLTLANDQLLAERLTGAEAGVNWTSPGRRTVVRATAFWSDITRPVESVTLSVTPNLIIRERENLGRTRSRGLNLDFEENLTQKMSLTAGYQFADATVLSFPGNPALVGRRIPQVPRHEATFQVRYSNPAANNPLARLTVGIQGRASSAAYDDDLNIYRLDPYFTLDALISHPLAHGMELFAAAENLTDQRYQVALTPVANLGPPILVRVGIRLDLGGR